MYEVPLGATIPAYYGLVASRYMFEFGTSEADLAQLAVLMRSHAVAHPGAQFRAPTSVDDVLASTPVVVLSSVLGRTPTIEAYKAAVDGIDLTRFEPPTEELTASPVSIGR